MLKSKDVKAQRQTTEITHLRARLSCRLGRCATPSVLGSFWPCDEALLAPARKAVIFDRAGAALPHCRREVSEVTVM